LVANPLSPPLGSMAQLTQSPQLLLFDDPHSVYCAKVRVTTLALFSHELSLPSLSCLCTGCPQVQCKQHINTLTHAFLIRR
jgi:hypothetical protein